MTRAPYCSVVVAVLSLAFAGSAFAQDAAKGASLLADARKALGGEDKLRAVKTLDVKSDFKRAAGQNTVEGELEEWTVKSYKVNPSFKSDVFNK